MIYAFDEADPELTLMPMAVRRALDAAGVKLSLPSWQTLARVVREALVRLGAADDVDVPAVHRLVAGASGPGSRAIVAYTEPAELPAALVDALAPDRPLSAERWRELSGLDRYVFDKLLRRSRLERLARAYDEICAVAPR